MSKLQTPPKLSLEGLDDQCSSRQRPLLAVPFKWEASPGIPTSPSSPSSPCRLSLPPPPRSSICSPHSSRSLSLSKKMRALLQGKMLLLPKKHQPSSSSTSGSSSSSPGSSSSSPVSPFDHFSSSTSSSPRSFVESEQLNDSPPPPASAASAAPFKSMSSMLLDLWHNQDRTADHYHLLVSPPANELNSSFSSSSSDSGVDESFDMFYQQQQQSFDHKRQQSFDQERQHSFVHFHDESRFDVDEEDDEFLYSGFKSFLNSDRFRFETSDSASLVSHFHRHNRLQSALKSSQRKSKARKQVRFADDDDQQEQECAVGPTILLRCSSRRFAAEDDDQLEYAADENSYCKKTRPRRDLSKLLMQIVQADAAEFAAKQHKKSLFLRSETSRWS